MTALLKVRHMVSDHTAWSSFVMAMHSSLPWEEPISYLVEFVPPLRSCNEQRVDIPVDWDAKTLNGTKIKWNEIKNNKHVYRQSQVRKPIGSEVKWAEC